jgi:DNA processing protein
MNRTEACIALNLIPQLGPVRLRKLLGVFAEPERILGARASQLKTVEGIGPELAESLSKWEDRVDLAAELRAINAFGAHVTTPWADDYPRHLREIYNPPIVLHVWGTLMERDNRAAAVVGSRKCSPYGLECARKLSFQLAYAGLTVVSGLARGIDTAAHQGALAAKGRTIAVLGSGLNDLYPQENLALAEKIAAQGAVVSEYPMAMPPSTVNFPYRNRIVAGWGQGLLVIEAGLKSGALITANQAIEHGRTVYAVPGPIDRASSAGTNQLIRQGAQLVTSAADLLDDLQTLLPPDRHHRRPTAPASPLPSTPSLIEASGDEKLLLEALSTGELTIDELVGKTGLGASQASAALLQMELRHLIEALPGQRFRTRTSQGS